MATQKYSNLAKTTLASNYTAADSTIDVGDASNFPASGDFIVAIGDPVAFFLKVTGVSGTTFTVTTTAQEGYGTTSNKLAGVAVTHVLTAGSLDSIRADMVQSGTISALPSAEKEGNLYLPTDGSFLYRDTGAAQQAWGPIAPSTPVDTSGWSWTNQGGATILNNGGCAQLLAPAAASTNLRILDRTIPSAPYTIVAAFNFVMKELNFCYGGLCFRDSGTGKLLTASLTYQNGDFFCFTKFNSFTSYNNDVGSSFGLSLLRSVAYIYFRVSDNGTTLTFDVSWDGHNWNSADTITRAAWITPTHYGIFANSENSAPVYVMLRSLTVT